MHQIVVQDLSLQRTSSKSLAGPILLRPIKSPVVQGWLRGRMEGGTPRPGCRSKGFENIFQQRLTKSGWVGSGLCSLSVYRCAY